MALFNCITSFCTESSTIPTLCTELAICWNLRSTSSVGTTPVKTLPVRHTNQNRATMKLWSSMNSPGYTVNEIRRMNLIKTQLSVAPVFLEYYYPLWTNWKFSTKCSTGIWRVYIYRQEEKGSIDGQGCLVFLPVAAEILLAHKTPSWQAMMASSLMSRHATRISDHQAKENGGHNCAINHNYTSLKTSEAQVL